MDTSSEALLAECQRAIGQKGSNLCKTRAFFGKQFETRCINQIRLMHWNILANSLAGCAEGDRYSFDVPPECLPWNFRRWRILEEIAIYNPDIITLVELDEGEDLLKDLAPLGYEMRFAKKTGDSKDGTGIFWKSSEFQVFDEERGPFNVEPPKDSKLKLSQVFHFMGFQPTNGGIPFVVCGLHLKATKTQEGEGIRVAQIKDCIKRIKSTFGSRYPIIICADFNASRVPLKGIKPMAVNVALKAGYSSCYEKVMGREPVYTSWKTRSGQTAKYTIDYLLTKGNILPMAVLGMVPEAKVPKFHFPNFQSASDHLSLVCDLEVGRSASTSSRKRNIMICGLTVLMGAIIWQTWRRVERSRRISRD